MRRISKLYKMKFSDSQGRKKGGTVYHFRKANVSFCVGRPFSKQEKRIQLSPTSAYSWSHLDSGLVSILDSTTGVV